MEKITHDLYLNYEHNYIKNVKYHKKEERTLSRACVCDLVCLLTEQGKGKKTIFDVMFFNNNKGLNIALVKQM